MHRMYQNIQIRLGDVAFDNYEINNSASLTNYNFEVMIIIPYLS
ncbi:hypothetical protein AbA118F_2170 [Acinetobacter baumannii]|nr:hypothetical protein [Acinetobacter baumannii]